MTPIEFRAQTRKNLTDAKTTTALDSTLAYAFALCETADAILTSMDQIVYVHGAFRDDTQALADLVTPFAQATLRARMLPQPREQKIKELYNEAFDMVRGDNDSPVFMLSQKPEIAASMANMVDIMSQMDAANERAMMMYDVSQVRKQVVADHFRDNVPDVDPSALQHPPMEIYAPLQRAKAAYALALHYEENEKTGLKQELENSFMKIADAVPLGTDYVPGFQNVALASYHAAAALFADAGKTDLAYQVQTVAQSIPVTDDQATGYTPAVFADQLIKSQATQIQLTNMFLDPGSIREMPYYAMPDTWVTSLERLGRDSNAPRLALPPIRQISQTPAP